MNNNIFRLRKGLEMKLNKRIPLRLIAEHCGVSLTCAKAWEHQRWQPNNEHIEVLAKFFSCDPSEILPANEKKD
jgi:hypothetical protein